MLMWFIFKNHLFTYCFQGILFAPMTTCARKLCLSLHWLSACRKTESLGQILKKPRQIDNNFHFINTEMNVMVTQFTRQKDDCCAFNASHYYHHLGQNMHYCQWRQEIRLRHEPKIHFLSF